MNKIQISNDRLWAIALSGDDIDQWLDNNIGPGKWIEWVGLTALPYRSFTFKDPRDETLFILRWGPCVTEVASHVD